MTTLIANVAVLTEGFGIERGLDVTIDGASIAGIAPHGSAAGIPDNLHDADNDPGRQRAPAVPAGIPDNAHHADNDPDNHGAPAFPKGAASPYNTHKPHVIDGTGRLLMPAFYNLHTHMPMSLLRGYGENMPLSDWLEQRVFPFEDRLTDGDCYHASLLHIAESFAHGIVSSSDMYYHCDAIVRAAGETGAKLNIARGLSCFDPDADMAAFAPLAEAKALNAEYGGAYGGRIRTEASLHAEYTATPRLIAAVAGFVHESGLPIHVHISETRSEHEACKGRHGGLTPTRLLAESGALDNGGTAAHCVWIEDGDADILKAKGMTVACCPVSNAKLASGMADTALLYRKGIPVALGTDGAASNNSMNFFEEIKQFSLIGKLASGDATAVPPAQALYAATRGGALAQGRADCGIVREGMRADLIMLELGAPSLNPMYEPASALAYAASSRDIAMTFADGAIVYRNAGGRPADCFPTLDLERVLREVGAAQARILGELAAAGA